MAENLLHCETGFGVYRSTQLGHIPFFLITISVGWPKYNSKKVKLYNFFIKKTYFLKKVIQKSCYWKLEKFE
jgi:hypothetical protein